MRQDRVSIRCEIASARDQQVAWCHSYMLETLTVFHDHIRIRDACSIKLTVSNPTSCPRCLLCLTAPVDRSPTTMPRFSSCMTRESISDAEADLLSIDTINFPVNPRLPLESAISVFTSLRYFNSETLLLQSVGELRKISGISRGYSHWG